MRGMRRGGRPPAWTRHQREQVLALAEEGVSQRAIAEQVFGDARYRGRVERILHERAMSAPVSDHAQGVTRAELDASFDAADVSVARELVARYERSLAESEEVPSLADIERLLRIKQRLEAAEMLKRACDLTRG